MSERTEPSKIAEAIASEWCAEEDDELDLCWLINEWLKPLTKQHANEVANYEAMKEGVQQRTADLEKQLAKAEAVIAECKAYRVMPPDVERAIAEYEASK